MSYDLTKDLKVIDNTFTLNPYWIVYVASFKTQNTFSRNDYQLTTPGNNTTGSNIDITQAMDTEPLIIVSDCINLSTTTEKGSHTSQLQATLLPGKQYLNSIFPGDWICAWMMNDLETFNKVLFNLKTNKQCNDFLDGLKFVGRIQTIRERVNIDPSSGTQETRYSLTATGFQELDSFFYYDPQIAIKYPAWNVFLANAGVIVNNIITNGNVSSNAIIPEMFNVLLGRGISSNVANPSNELQIATGPVSTQGSPFAYLVPGAIGQILGRSPKQSFLSYADIMDMTIGIHKYTDSNDYKTFLPDGLNNSSGVNRVGSPIVGNFNPDTPQFVNKTVWALLNQFLNNTINEMFTCLRVNKDGKVVPHTIVRQLPFSSLIRANQDTELTAMLELPRWKLKSNLIRGYDIGRSDTLRTNFVHLTGQSPMSSTVQLNQLARNGVFMDQQDIKRNGLRMDVQTLSCAVQDIAAQGPTKWMKIRADFVIDQNLTLNGTFNLVGVQAPICEGDNLEFNGNVYHIESVSHFCSIDSEGRKYFDTSLAVTHGSADIDNAQEDSDLFPNLIRNHDTTKVSANNISFEDSNE